MKKKITVIIAGILVLCIIIVGGTYFNHKPGAVHLRDISEIASVQRHSIRVSASKYGESNLKELLSIIGNATPVRTVEARKLTKGNEYMVISLINTDDSKDIFCFFKQDGVLYMETADGSIYTDVDDIQGDTGSLFSKDLWYDTTTGIACGSYIPEKEDITYALDTDFDLRYQYKCMVQNEMQYTDEVDADKIKMQLRSRYSIYNYALENGYTMPEGEHEKIMEGWIADAKAEKDYAKVEHVYEEAGTTLENYMRKMGEQIWCMDNTIDYMVFCIKEQYIEGKEDTVNGTVYDSATDYYTAYNNEIIVPALDDSTDAEFEQKLEEAEAYWEEHAAITNEYAY